MLQLKFDRNELEFIKNDIKQLQNLIATGKKLALQFPDDAIMVQTVLQYEQRLKFVRQALRKVKKKEVTLTLSA